MERDRGHGIVTERGRLRASVRRAGILADACGDFAVPHELLYKGREPRRRRGLFFRAHALNDSATFPV